MSKEKVTIVINGGVCSEVYFDDEKVEVDIIDFDNPSYDQAIESFDINCPEEIIDDIQSKIEDKNEV